MSGHAVSTAEPEQLFLPMFLPHVKEAMKLILLKKTEKSLERKAKSLVPKGPVFKRNFDTLSADLFDAPLGSVEDVELSTSIDPYTECGDEDPALLSDEAAMDWSEAAIYQLHEGMVMYSLRLLNARGNGKEKKAILSWIFDPQAKEYSTASESGEPVWELLNPSEVPFSFELCCRIAGLNPERIREGLVPVLKHLDLDELFKEVENARECDQSTRAATLRDSYNFQYSRGAGRSEDSGIQEGAPRSAGSGSLLSVRD